MFEALFRYISPQREVWTKYLPPKKTINFPHRLRTSIRNLCCQHLYQSFYRSYHHILSKYQNASINANNKIIPKIITPFYITGPSDTTLNPMQTPPRTAYPRNHLGRRWSYIRHAGQPCEHGKGIATLTSSLQHCRSQRHLRAAQQTSVIKSSRDT